jgi:hypothetical protein
MRTDLDTARDASRDWDTRDLIATGRGSAAPNAFLVPDPLCRPETLAFSE